MVGSKESRDGMPDPKRFEFRWDPPLEGVTPTILANLYDIAIKWGKLDPNSQYVTYRSGNLEKMGFELYAKAEIGTDKNYLTVSKGLLLNNIGFPTKNGFVLWDTSLSAEEVQNAISYIDEKAKEKGLIDTTGIRRPLKPEDSLLRQGELPKHAVKLDFPRKGTIVFVPKGVSPLEALKIYDQPDLLDIVNLPIFGSVICRKEDVDPIRLKGVITRKVLLERGINTDNPNGLNGMSRKDLEDIDKEIERRLKERN